MRKTHNLFCFFVLFLLGCSKNDNYIESYTDGSSTLELYSVLPGLSIHQSIAVFNDLALFMMYEDSVLYADVYSLNRNEFKGKIYFPYANYKRPHANTISFGKKFYSNKSFFPLLYVSQWDFNGERGVLVYDIQDRNGRFIAELVQSILPGAIGEELIHFHDIDWVVDCENDRLYAITYKLNGENRLGDTNAAEIFIEFAIPDFHRKEVILDRKSVLSFFMSSLITDAQDKICHNGKILIVSGKTCPSENERNTVRIIDLSSRREEAIIDIGKVRNIEPEGFVYYNGSYLLTFCDYDRPNCLWKFDSILLPN